MTKVHVNYCFNRYIVRLRKLSILLFKGLPPVWDPHFFWFKNASTPLCLSRDKIKRQFGKNTILTSTKTLFKKQGHSFVDFQIILSTYKLDFQNKNYIYKIKIQVIFLFVFKKPHRMHKACVMSLVSHYMMFFIKFGYFKRVLLTEPF